MHHAHPPAPVQPLPRIRTRAGTWILDFWISWPQLRSSKSYDGVFERAPACSELFVPATDRLRHVAAAPNQLSQLDFVAPANREPVEACCGGSELVSTRNCFPRQPPAQLRLVRITDAKRKVCVRNQNDHIPTKTPPQSLSLRDSPTCTSPSIGGLGPAFIMSLALFINH